MNNYERLEMAPGSDQQRLQAIVSLVDSGNLDAAAEAASRIADKDIGNAAWRRIAAANANMQRFGAARFALERALQTHPGSRDLRLEHALLLEREGLADESRAELEQLAGEAVDSPQLLVHLARALRFAGREDEAEQHVVTALQRWPLDLAAHRLLAELRYRAGAGAECTAPLEAAIARFPQELQLRLVAAELLRNADAPRRALALLEEGLRRAPGATAFETSIGVVLGDLGRVAESLAYLRSACARAPESVPMKRNLLPALLRAGEAQEGLRLADALLAGAPDDQQLVAHRATALRLAGDARYAALVDHARLVRRYFPAPPAGFADIAAFNLALARALEPLHRSGVRPLAQSVRGGTQTERNLPACEPLVAAFLAMIDGPIRDYIASLDAANAWHPTDRRKCSNYRIAGSWSVLLRPGGHHTNHVHPQGWISSAYYVDIPPVDDAARGGWLQFGAATPPVPGCGPELFVRPEPGMLVLFPSFMWHGTVPFQKGERRLTAAFDLVPG